MLVQLLDVFFIEARCSDPTVLGKSLTRDVEVNNLRIFLDKAREIDIQIKPPLNLRPVRNNVFCFHLQYICVGIQMNADNVPVAYYPLLVGHGFV